MKIAYMLDEILNPCYNIYIRWKKSIAHWAERECNFMKQFMENVKVADFGVNENGDLKQNVRNAFKADVMQALKDLLAEAGVQVSQVKEGLAVEFENDELGSVVVVFDGVVKGKDFDVLDAVEDFENHLKEKAEKALKAEALKAQKLAEKEFLAKQKAEKVHKLKAK